MDRSNPPTTTIERFLDPGYLELEQVLDAIDFEVAPSVGLFGNHRLELRQCPPRKRKLAITISGGGASGAYSAGLLEVLLDRLRKRGIEIGLIVGTSSGALNGYGIFLQKLGLGNEQFKSEPSVRQPYCSLLASIWSYLARDGKASRWIVGKRSWIVRLASRGLPSGRVKLWLVLAALAAVIVVQPYLLLPLAGLAAMAGADLPAWIAPHSPGGSAPLLFVRALGGALLLAVSAWLAMRAFGQSLFLDVPLFRLLANSGRDGDLRRRPLGSRGQAIDQASVLSRDLVAGWYGRRQELPEFILTGTDLTAARGCLFTLVRPETYRLLLRREWMAVQFEPGPEHAEEYRSEPDAQYALPESFLQAVVASTAVPGAFPTQRIGVFRPDSREVEHHHLVDGGVLNNSPIHIAIDAGATHVISLETQPLSKHGRARKGDRRRKAYGLLEAALATFTTVLERATDEDIRRTASWNRFLISKPRTVGPGGESDGKGALERRIVMLYRVAPRERMIGTVEFDGRIERGRRTLTLRDLLRQGIHDMKGRNIWAATIRHEPAWKDPRRGRARSSMSRSLS